MTFGTHTHKTHIYYDHLITVHLRGTAHALLVFHVSKFYWPLLIWKLFSDTLKDTLIKEL